MVHGYWRPVLNNHLRRRALWDIKGKRAGMSVCDLLGGKSREAAHVYVHADGRDKREVAANARAYMEQGFRFIRVQMGGYGRAAMVRWSNRSRLRPALTSTRAIIAAKC